MIIYRDRRLTPRHPLWLSGCANLARVDLVGGGCLVAAGDPWRLALREDQEWHELEDGWEVCLDGEPEQELLLRSAPGLSSIEVIDANERTWLVPAVLTPDGRPAMPMRLGIVGHDLVDGQRVPRWDRRPTPAQQRLIAIATAVRGELDAGTFRDLPAATAAEMTGQLLAATYHLTPSVVGALSLLDDRICIRALLACAGHVGG